jgi:hypothetical protein
MDADASGDGLPEPDQPALRAGLEAGKSPVQLLSSASKDYVGNLVPAFAPAAVPPAGVDQPESSMRTAFTGTYSGHFDAIGKRHCIYQTPLGPFMVPIPAGMSCPPTWVYPS